MDEVLKAMNDRTPEYVARQNALNAEAEEYMKWYQNNKLRIAMMARWKEGK